VSLKDEILPKRQVSTEYGIPENTLSYWRAMGTGPKSAKLGRRVVYRRSDVEAWIDAQFAAEDKELA